MRVDDIVRVVDYYEKYLEKYGCLKDRETADLNIRFWYQFGSLYYIEGIDGIKVLAAVTVVDTSYLDDAFGHALSMSLFPFYDTDNSLTLCNGIMTMIPGFILDEQGLDQMPVRLNMVKDDTITGALMSRGGWDTIEAGDDVMAHQYIVLHGKPKEELPEPEKDEKLKAFFGKFSNIEDEVRHWLGGNKTMEWMMDEVKLGL